jgi:ABC-type dipeptide/oligopeptide/nickel transport system permease subunit
MQPRSTRQQALRRFKKNKSGVFGLILLLLMTGFAAYITLTQPFPTTKVLDASLMPLEDPTHLLGTDIAGRDMVRLLAWGTRTSIVIALATEVFVMIVSLLFGFLSGWFGGVVDFVITRVIEVFVSIPPLLFQPLFIILMGATIPNLVLAIGALSWTEPTRLVRAQTLQFRDREFINASRALGVDMPRIAVRHVLPNILNPFIIAVTMNIPAIILAESTLSFLGYGLTEGNPSLGKMIGVSYQYIQAYWHMALLPTACLSLLMLGVSLFGDGLRDAIDTQS